MILPYQPARKYRYFIMLALTLLLNAAAFAQLNSRYLTQYTELDGVPGAQVNKVLPDRLGYIWIGTINGLARYDGYEFKRYFNNPNDSNSIQGGIVWSLFEDHKGQIWAGCSPSYLNVYNPVTKSFRQQGFTHLVEHPANVELGIVDFAEDNKGRIYLGVMSNYGERLSSGLLYVDENDGETKKFTTPDSLPVQNVYKMKKDKDGNIWVMSYSGLFKIDANRKISKFHSLDEPLKLKNEGATDIYFDKEGQMWVITSKSRLINFNQTDGTYKIFTPEGTLNDDRIYNSMAIDKNENIWMGTSKGLTGFNRKLERFEFFKNELP